MKKLINCPECGLELEVEIELSEHFIDIPEICECGAELGKLAPKIESDCISREIDRVYDIYKDKELS